jgi:hypothetical protein
MPLHHTADAVCPLCEEKLKDAHAELVKWFRNLKEAFPDVHTSCTYRGKEEQDLFFKQGMSKLKYPNSMHNKTKDGKPCSRAIDLFQIRSDQVPCWQKSYYQKLTDHLKAQDAPLDWGWDLWAWDAPHYQLKKSVK